MSVLIRRAVLGDEETVFRFISALAKYEKLEHELSASKSDIARNLFCTNPRVYCEIAELDGEPVGFALWYYTFSTFKGRHGIWLEDLFVDPNIRGAGIGKKLMKFLAKKCADENLSRFEWWVLDWNKSAIDFYRSIKVIMQDEWSVCRLDGEALKQLGSASVKNAKLGKTRFGDE